MRRLLLALMLALVPNAVWAACANTVSIKDGAGSTQTFCRGTDGGTNFIGAYNIIDSTGVNFLGINGSGQMAIQAPPSLPLPTGAATSAKQPALGTAGVASTDVITVQGIASMTALKVDGSAVTQPVSGTITANIGTSGSLALDATLAKLNVGQGTALGTNTGPMMQGSVTTAAPTYTTGQISPLSLSTTGALRVDNSGVTQPVSGTVTANAGTNLNTSALALESGGNLATVASGILSQASTTAGQKGLLIQGAVTTAAPTYTTGQTDPISLDTAGNIRVNCTTGCSSSGGSSLADQGTFTQGTTSFTVVGGEFNNTPTTLTSGQAGAVQLTSDRSMFTNLNKVGGNAVKTSSGAGSTGSLNVYIATDQPALTNAQPGNFAQIGGTSVSTGVGAADTGTQRVAVSNSAGCTSKLVNTITASTDILTSVAKLHICSVIFVDSAAEQVSLVEGTGTTCATGTSALLGATTADATHGLPLAANGGLSSISGIPWIETGVTADHLCILKSGAGNLSYTITYADHS